MLLVLFSAFLFAGCAADAQKPAQVVPMLATAYNVRYAAPDNMPLCMDIYPAKDQSKPAPVVIWLHGGGWIVGDKNGVPILWLTECGYTVVSGDYRLTTVRPWPAQIYDCKAMVRFLRANAALYNIDPKHIAVSGHSAGAHLAAMMGTSGGVKKLEGDLGNPDQSSRVQAVFEMAGPTDLMAWHKTGVGHATNDPNSILSKLVGGPVLERKDVVAEASVTTYVDKNDPPFFIAQGEADGDVAVSQSDLLVEQLKKAGVEVEYERLPNVGHGIDMNVFRDKLVAFLDRHMK